MVRGNSLVSVWFTLLLGMLFALCTLFLVLFGADVYTSVLDNASENDVSRTATLYIANKIRQSDAVNGVSIGYVEGDSALLLRDTVDGESILTYLYLYKGELCEVSVAEGTLIQKSSGQPVLPISSFSLIEKNGSLRVELADANGHSADFVLALRTAEANP